MNLARQSFPMERWKGIGIVHGGGQPVAINCKADDTARTVADGRDGLANGGDDAAMVLHQLEIYRFVVFGGADNTQGIARQSASIHLDADVHILPGGTAKSLPGSLAW